MTKQQYFDAVAKELEQQHLDRGLWARAFAETNGDQERARALYIRLRVAQLEHDAPATSAPTKPKKDTLLNILMILLSCIGLAVMMGVVKECNRPAEHLGGFMNVAWSTSPEEAKRIMSQRDGVVFDFEAPAVFDVPVNRFQTQFYHTGSTFLDLEVDALNLEFLDSRFYQGSVTLKPHPTLRDTWEHLTAGFTKKYGLPSVRDDNRWSAIWWFPKEDIQCLKAPTQDDVVVFYENTSMTEEAIRAHR